MKMIFKAFVKKLFGAKYESLARTLPIYLIIFWGLSIANWRVQIAPFIRYLMVSTFTAGVMWQALSSEEHGIHMQNMFMLPFDSHELIFSYIAALGVYTILTKTAALLAILLAVSVWSLAEIWGSAVCLINAILMTAAIYSLKKYWYVSSLWVGAIIAIFLLFREKPWFLLALIVNSIFTVIFLQRADGYTFYLQDSIKSHAVKRHKHGSVWRYLFRYLKYHKNYLMNTVIMWCVAVILPNFLKQMGSLFVVPIGFAILSLNTPICILLSCDLDLEQAIRFLPGQKKAFCMPYCLFIFLCNMAANVIFLFSWNCQNSNVTVLMVATGVFFALQSAILSVLLEWFFPIRGWEIESDLWHHPRKYIVPIIMLFLAGMVGALPKQMPLLITLLAIEIIILVFACWRYSE